MWGERQDSNLFALTCAKKFAGLITAEAISKYQSRPFVTELPSSTEKRRKNLLIRALEEQGSRHKRTTLAKDQQLASVVSVIDKFPLNGNTVHHNEWLHEPTTRCDTTGHRGRF
jgi:hypothetical protein